MATKKPSPSPVVSPVAALVAHATQVSVDPTTVLSAEDVETLVAAGPTSNGDPAEFSPVLSNTHIDVNIKLLSPSAKVPTYGTAGAACFDLYAADTVAVLPGRSAVVKTDVAFEVPDGHVLKIYSRSGHGFKNGVRLANGTGIVDSDYRGHVPVCLHNDGRETFVVRQGDRVAQAMVEPVLRVEFNVVDELSETARGENGFGSTGA